MEKDILAGNILGVFAVLLSGFEDPTGLLLTFPKDQIMKALEQISVVADSSGFVLTLEGDEDNGVNVGIEVKEEDESA